MSNLEDRIQKLEQALKPFADSFVQFQKEHVKCFSIDTPDDTPILIDNEADAHYFICKVGDFRRAAEILGFPEPYCP